MTGLGHGVWQGLAVAPCPPGESWSRMWSWHVSCALWRVLRPFLQGADPAGGGLPAEPEAEGGLRGAGGAAEPKPGRAENIPGKWGLGRSSEPGRERVPLGPALPTGAHEVWVDVPNSPPAPQTLSLQRQMMENLVIAKAREETVSFPVGLLREPLPCPACHRPHTALWGPSWGMEEGEGRWVSTVLALGP